MRGGGRVRTLPEGSGGVSDAGGGGTGTNGNNTAMIVLARLPAVLALDRRPQRS